jgi:hypothetical protein
MATLTGQFISTTYFPLLQIGGTTGPAIMDAWPNGLFTNLNTELTSIITGPDKNKYTLTSGLGTRVPIVVVDHSDSTPGDSSHGGFFLRNQTEFANNLMGIQTRVFDGKGGLSFVQRTPSVRLSRMFLTSDGFGANSRGNLFVGFTGSELESNTATYQTSGGANHQLYVRKGIIFPHTDVNTPAYITALGDIELNAIHQSNTGSQLGRIVINQTSADESGGLFFRDPTSNILGIRHGRQGTNPFGGLNGTQRGLIFGYTSGDNRRMFLHNNGKLWVGWYQRTVFGTSLNNYINDGTLGADGLQDQLDLYVAEGIMIGSPHSLGVGNRGGLIKVYQSNSNNNAKLRIDAYAVNKNTGQQFALGQNMEIFNSGVFERVSTGLLPLILERQVWVRVGNVVSVNGFITDANSAQLNIPLRTNNNITDVSGFWIADFQTQSSDQGTNLTGQIDFFNVSQVQFKLITNVTVTYPSGPSKYFFSYSYTIV